MSQVIMPDKVQGEYLLHWFPRILCRQVALPFDQVLQFAPPAVMAVI